MLHARPRSLDATDTLEFEEQEGPRGSRQTVVTYTAAFELLGVAKVAAPLFRRMLKRVADHGAAGMESALVRDLA